MPVGRRPEAGGQTGAARGRHDPDALVARHAQLDKETPGHRQLPHGYERDRSSRGGVGDDRYYGFQNKNTGQHYGSLGVVGYRYVLFRIHCV